MTADARSADRARALDAADPLRALRDRFYQPADGAIYLDGNSLGLLSRDAEAAVLDRAERLESARHRRLAGCRLV